MGHMMQCVASLMNNEFGSPEVHRCFINWFMKTQTTFFEVDLNLPLWFGLFCFNYSISGIVMLLTKPKWIQRSWFPYTAFAYLLIFVQGPLSYLADYVHMSNESFVHAIDRALAVSLVALEGCKVGLMILHGTMRSTTVTIYLMATIAALVSFLNSSEAQRLRDRDGFVFWHGMWHFYPLVGSFIISVDYYVFGGDHGHDKNRTMETANKQQHANSVPLSSYLMSSGTNSKIKTF